MNNRSGRLSSSNVRKLECPFCGHMVMHEVTREITFHYGVDDSVAITVTMPLWVCERCDSAFMDWRGEKIEHDAICRHLGLLTPAEIRGIRERYGLTQAELARLMGFGERSIKRWEKGGLFQNASADRFLRLIDDDPEVIEKLRRIAERLAK